MWWLLGPKPVKLVKMMEGVNSFYDQLSMAQDVKKGKHLHRTMIARWHSKLFNRIPIEREFVVVLVRVWRINSSSI